MVAGLIKVEKKQVQRNRRIHQRLVDITVLLARQGLAFGHSEYAGAGNLDSNEGNFLELLKLLAHHDSTIEQHLTNLVGHVTYLSHQSQNKLLIALVSETLNAKITIGQDSKVSLS